MDDSMENLMSQIPLSGRIKDVLISKAGELGNFLILVESYEKGDWDQICEITDNMGLVEDDLPRHYMESLNWADGLNVLQ
jgi:EAL and modified HD-GYP domain-containing signal transduction protein